MRFHPGQALSQAGQHTLLFDGDLGLANVDIQLGLMPKRDIAGVIAGKLTLPQAVTNYAEGHFDILAGRSGAARIQRFDPEEAGLEVFFGCEVKGFDGTDWLSRKEARRFDLFLQYAVAAAAQATEDAGLGDTVPDGERTVQRRSEEGAARAGQVRL